MPTLDPQIFLIIILALVQLVGLVSLVIPILPGLVIIWIANLVYGITAGFTVWGWVIFAINTILMIVGSLVDNITMGASAKMTGASWLGVGLSLVAGLVGSLLFPPLGGLVAALMVLFVVEIIRLRDFKRAGNSTASMALGCGLAIVIRFAMGLVMIGLWSVWVFIVN
jgi:uncharacterized protein YqgC (DUF456 family)